MQQNRRDCLGYAEAPVTIRDPSSHYFRLIVALKYLGLSIHFIRVYSVAVSARHPLRGSHHLAPQLSHFTRAQMASIASLRGVPISEICGAVHICTQQSSLIEGSRSDTCFGKDVLQSLFHYSGHPFCGHELTACGSPEVECMWTVACPTVTWMHNIKM